MTGSELYQRQIIKGDNDLLREVWGSTPWMVQAYTGSWADDRIMEIREWCTDEFGPEAWPIHGKPGRWHSGGATVNGWTWMGFETEEMMHRFIERWPAPARTEEVDCADDRSL